MRGDRAARDTRHNKDHEHLKSSLKKGNKSKKNRVIFDESANEFFDADYIIVVRNECGYSDEGEGEECGGCGSCERYAEPDPGALSPPEGYKDLGLFNRDGTLREQAWWEAGDVVLVGERSGTVFTPQHLQLLRRLQRERLLRAAVCADCDHHHQPLEVEYNYEDEESSDVDRELRPVARRTAKHIAAGEERPKINSSQQTTPTDECPELRVEEPQLISPTIAPATSEESDTAELEGQISSESSPQRHRRAGILKGGRLWKSIDNEKDLHDQNEDQRSTTASDEDGSFTPRSVRFVEKPKDSIEGEPSKPTDLAQQIHMENDNMSSNRNESPNNLPKTNSAVQQLFNNVRQAAESQLTSETLRAWDAGVRPSAEDTSIRRVAERNTLRCSLLRSEARKKQQPKNETTSLADRIRLLTCDVEDETEDLRSSPSGASVDKYSSTSDKSSEKSYNSLEKNEKAFGSASSSSSSSTLSVPVPTRRPPDLGDVHHEPQKPRAEPRRQFLSTLAPLTACVGSTGHHEGFYYLAPGDRTSASSATNLNSHEPTEAPAPDVVAGTPGANDGDDSLAAFARASAPRTERLRQKYGQESQPVSSDDEHDDYGFHRRPAVRGISVRQQLGAADEILHQMQNELQPSAAPTATPAPNHACQRSNSNNYSWNYYSDNSRPQSRASATSNWSKSSDYVTARPCNSTPVQVTAAQHTDACYAHAQTMVYAHYQQQQDVYRTCSLYANVGCSDSSQELYSSQTSSEQTSPIRSGARYRRPESPPPIRSHHQLLYVPYTAHYHYQHQDYAMQHQWNPSDYSRVHYYPAQSASQPAAAAPAAPAHPQYTHAFQIQNLCPAPARYRSVPAQQPGSGKQMICFSEKVAAPLYQAAAAPGSPARARGAPEGAPAAPPLAATSPTAPAPVYYAMNV